MKVALTRKWYVTMSGIVTSTSEMPSFRMPGMRHVVHQDGQEHGQRKVREVDPVGTRQRDT